MSIEAAIYLVIVIAAICGGAWVLAWIATEKVGAPPVAAMVIWIIAGLLVLLVLLKALGVLNLHAEVLGMLPAALPWFA